MLLIPVGQRYRQLYNASVLSLTSIAVTKTAEGAIIVYLLLLPVGSCDYLYMCFVLFEALMDS